MARRDYPQNIVICIPVFNDWKSIVQLINELKLCLPSDLLVQLVLVDDGSIEQPDMEKLGSQTEENLSIDLIRLVTNIGHQRAIAVGLSAIQSAYQFDAAVVMDGDGEDNPRDILKLLKELVSSSVPSIVFAQRSRRSESLFFRAGYQCFKILHRILTGFSCDVGNFSAIPTRWLKQLTHSPELWNHYAATVISSRIPVSKVSCPRNTRYSGQSAMNITSLVTHGLRAISVFGETVGVRVIAALGAVGLLSVAGLLAVISIRLFTDLAIPGWATNATGLILILCLNFLVLSAISLLFVLGTRSSPEFISARDWEVFVEKWDKLGEREI